MSLKMRAFLHSKWQPFLVGVLSAVLFVDSVRAEHIIARIDRLVQQATYHGTEPASGVDCAVEALAENIDWLEHHIDAYGSIVAKSPDIWGEARLTKFRDEYERIMFRELAEFDIKINATLSQSDSAFLSQAIALSAAATGSSPQPTAVGSATAGTTTAATQNASTAIAASGPASFTNFNVAQTNPISLEPVIGLDQLSRYLNHLHELRRINEGDDTSDSPGYSLNLVRMPISILPGKLTRTGFGAEITVTCTPVITDDLLPTTFHNLAVNDMVDLLGLPLVRVTEGRLYGSITPFVEYLPVLRKNMRRIELAFGPPASTPNKKEIIEAAEDILKYPELRDGIISALLAAWNPAKGVVDCDGLQVGGTTNTRGVGVTVLETRFSESGAMRSFREGMTAAVAERLEKARSLPESYGARVAVVDKQEDDLYKKLVCAFVSNKPIRVADEVITMGASNVAALLRVIDDYASEQEKLAQPVPTGRARRALNPINPTFILRIVGLPNFLQMSKEFEPAYSGRYIRWNGGGNNTNCDHRVDLLDAQRFLQAELEAAHELLARPENVLLYAAFAAPCSGLAKQIRNGNLTESTLPDHTVEQYRHQFFRELHRCCYSPANLQTQQDAYSCKQSNYEALPLPMQDHDSIPGQSSKCEDDEEARNTVEVLAWALVVESALLNERLNLDVRKVAKSKEAYQLDTNRDYLFFLPETVNSPHAGLEELQGEFQEATNIFKEYVKVRWPIHVFAVDPREQDQNVADVSARKRELQFALALGFVTGQIGVNSLTQYSRELQTQIETIALNRTVVGFGHGDDVFGWRFQPRVQGLYVPNNCGAIRELLCGVSRDYDLRHRQLEPGQRDCTAIVLMPSFVPYADFDVRTNWYKLTNPKNAAITMKETLRLSRAITTMRNSQQQCMECAHLYRDNEIGRLLKRVDQLDHELPLQTMRTLVPYENTVGGFEMFNTGVTDLSPELIGWYGAPGIVVSDNLSNQYKCGCTRPCGTDGAVASVVRASNELLGKTADGKEIRVLADVSADPLPICEGEGTSVFLVGDNFSVHDTKVIAGGVCIPHVQLVSRQIMRITVPSCVQTVRLCENGKTNEYVAVYVATPYGVTNHLHVPVHKIPTPAAAVISVEPKDLANKTVQVKATCDDKCAKIDKSEVTTNPKVIYNYVNHPKYDGKKAIFYAQLMFGSLPLGTPVRVFDEPTIKTRGEFDAMGDGKELKDQLKLSLNALVKEGELCGNKKMALKLVFFALADDQTSPVRIPGEIDVVVTIECKTPGGGGGAGTGTPQNPVSQILPQGSTSFVPAGWQPSQMQPSQRIEAEPLPFPAGETGPHFIYPETSPPSQENGAAGDCGCGQLDPCFPAEQAYALLPAAPRRLPVQQAQFTFAVNEAQPESNSDPAFSATDATLRLDAATVLLSEINTLKLQLAAQQTAIQAALERDEDVPAAAVAGQSVINVNIQHPPGHGAWLYEQISCPCVHRAFVRGRECWRNVRDELPCN